MDDSEGINEIVSLVRKSPGEILAIGMNEADPILQAKDDCSAAGNLQGTLGNISSGNEGTVARKIDRVRTDVAANLQNLLVPPPPKI